MITITLDGYSELLDLAHRLVQGEAPSAPALPDPAEKAVLPAEPVAPAPAQTPVAPMPLPTAPAAPAPLPTVPTAPAPAPALPTAPAAALAPVPMAPAPMLAAPVPMAPAPMLAAPVPTSAASYTTDDLIKAATPLMDAGRQGDLIALLKTFGVDALPELPPDKMGAFATALRGMGAQI